MVARRIESRTTVAVKTYKHMYAAMRLKHVSIIVFDFVHAQLIETRQH